MSLQSSDRRSWTHSSTSSVPQRGLKSSASSRRRLARYLRSLPGRAGNLDIQFQRVDDADAIDLLRRMLQFDPTMRASCEEILAQDRYFESEHVGLNGFPQRRGGSRGRSHEHRCVRRTKAEFWEIDHPGLALEELEKAFVRVREKGEKRRGKMSIESFLRRSVLEVRDSSIQRWLKKRSQDKSLLALFPDFFRGEEAVEYKLMSNTDEREVVHQYGFAEGGSWRRT